MLTIGLAHYLTVSAILFVLGIFGIFLNRKNVIVILMSIELILLSVNLNLVAFSSRLDDLDGPGLRDVHPDRGRRRGRHRARHRRHLLPEPRQHRGRGYLGVERLVPMFVGAVFFPLLGACISGFLNRWIGVKASIWSSVTCMVLAAICGSLAFWQVALGGQPTTVTIFTWMDVGELEFAWALRYDTLSAIMVGMVTFISTLIHIYSVGYMSHDATPPRFFAYLSSSPS
jgi:hypothetical protein